MRQPWSSQRNCSNFSRNSSGVGLNWTRASKAVRVNPYRPTCCIQGPSPWGMGLRLNIWARPAKSRTTLTRWGEWISGSAGMDLARVTTAASGFRSISASWAIWSGWTKGSSPCTLRTPSNCPPCSSSATTASWQRTVPLGQSAEVMTASPPKPRTTSWMRASSVATTTLAQASEPTLATRS